MIDGSDARLRSVKCARLSHGVDSNNCAQPARLGDGSRQLLGSVLVRRSQFAIDHLVRAGLIDLGKVRALFMLLAQDFDQLFGGVGIVGIGEHVLRRIVAVGVFVSSEDVDRVAADTQARSRDNPPIDGVAYRCVGGACSLRAHIALGGEARHQVGLCRLLGKNHSPWYRFFDRLQIFGTRMQKEVNMRVDQTRCQCRITKVDYAGILRMLNGLAHFANAFALDEDFSRLQYAARIHLEQSRGMQNDGSCWLLGECDACAKESAEAQDADAESSFSHGYEYNKRRRKPCPRGPLDRSASGRQGQRWLWCAIGSAGKFNYESSASR